MPETETETNLDGAGNGFAGGAWMAVGLMNKDKAEVHAKLGRFGGQALVGKCRPLYITGRPPTPPATEDVDVDAGKEAVEKVEAVRFPAAEESFRSLLSRTSPVEFVEPRVVRDSAPEEPSPVQKSSGDGRDGAQVGAADGVAASPPTSEKKRLRNGGDVFKLGTIAQETKKLAEEIEAAETEKALEASIASLEQQTISGKKRRKLGDNSREDEGGSRPVHCTPGRACTESGERGKDGDPEEDCDRAAEDSGVSGYDQDLSFEFSSFALTTKETEQRGFNPYIL